MADTSQNPLFSLLAARYGVSTALNILGLLGASNASPVGQGLGATQAAGGALSGAGYLSGTPGLSQLGQGLGTAAGLGGLGYGLYNTITDPRLSTSQKAGQAGIQGAEGAVALSPALAGATAGTAAAPVFAALAPAAPYLAAFLAAQAVGGQMEKSGSPQIRAGGRQVLAPLLPITNFLSIIGGKQSPRAAANATIEGMKQVPVVGGPLGKMFGLFGLGTKPTTGTLFRNELGSVLNQIPQLKGTDLTKYNIDPNAYNAFSPDVQKAGMTLGQLLAAYAPSGKANPNAYAIQAQNILLNRFGNDLPTIMTQVLPLLTGGKPAPTTSPATPTTPPAVGGFGSILANLLSGAANKGTMTKV